MPDPPPAQKKQTPGSRRRPGPNFTRSGNRKNYASENDASVTDFRPDFVPRPNNRNGAGGGTPTTPQKTPKPGAPAKSPAPPSQSASATGKAGKRNANKGQAKDAVASPAAPATAPAKAGRRTPPQPAGGRAAGPAAAASATPAFAGATFHASPAPSALPLPSFLAKRNSPGTPSVRPTSGLSQQPSPPASDSELPSATATTAATAATAAAGPGLLSASSRNPMFPPGGVSIPPPRDESPLDAFFRASRAEEERKRRASYANVYGAQPAFPVSPPAPTQAMSSHANGFTFPRNNGPQQPAPSQLSPQQPVRRPGQPLRTSSSGISAAELDGTPGQPIGPAFATPFQDRIRAARPTEPKAPPAAGLPGLPGLPAGFRDLPAGAAPMPPNGPGAFGSQGPGALTVGDRSEALKRLLFSKTRESAAAASTAHTASAPATPTRFPGPPNVAPHPAGYYQAIYTPSSASGTPSRPVYAPAHTLATPNSLNGSNGAAGGSSDVAAMEDSLRQLLKLGSPFGSGTAPSGLPRQS